MTLSVRHRQPPITVIIGGPQPRPRAPLDRTTGSSSIIFSADPPISVAALNLTYWPSSPGFTYVGQDRPEGHKPEQPKFTKVRSGRPEGFVWDDIWIEICRHVHYEGLPPTVAELTRYVQQVLRRDEH